MAATNINIRTDSELKAKAQSVLADLGLDMSTAINVFLKQIVYKQAIPFEISKSSIKQTKFGDGKIKFLFLMILINRRMNLGIMNNKILIG